MSYVVNLINFGTIRIYLDARYKGKTAKVMNQIWEEIPAEISIITCFGTGVIANDPREDHQGVIVQRVLELQSEKLPFLVGLVIPKVVGLGIKKFVVTKDQCKMLKGNVN